jgi:hypothetical protein
MVGWKGRGVGKSLTYMKVGGVAVTLLAECE